VWLPEEGSYSRPPIILGGKGLIGLLINRGLYGLTKFKNQSTKSVVNVRTFKKKGIIQQ
jgi:hypothetical protein